MLKELLDVILAPANHTLSILGMEWELSETMSILWMLPFMGAVISFKLTTLMLSRTNGGSRNVGGNFSLS